MFSSRSAECSESAGDFNAFSPAHSLYCRQNNLSPWFVCIVTCLVYAATTNDLPNEISRPLTRYVRTTRDVDNENDLRSQCTSHIL